MRRGLLGAFVLVTGVLVGWLGGWQLERAHSANSPEEGLRVGQRPPSFSAEDLSGAQHTLEQYQGQLLVLHFWASWCPFCRGEIPKLKRLHDDWAQRGVQILAVSVDEDTDRLRQFIAQAGLPYAVIADLEHSTSIAGAYGVGGIPSTYLISPDGLVLLHVQGQFDLVGAVDRALTHQTLPESS